SAAIEASAAEMQASLDLEAGPILRAVLFDTGSGPRPGLRPDKAGSAPGPARPNRLLIVVHQLAIDGVSSRILLEDLWSAYEQRAKGISIALPPKTTSFKRWGERLVEAARSADIEAESAYWLSDVRRAVSRLPRDYEDGE